MSKPFDQSALNVAYQNFIEQAPAVLLQNKITEALATELEQSLVLAEAPLTLAVVGPMRVGKSTLINALAGAELALPGVTETTATVNWFRYGTEEQARRFRVRWMDPNRGDEEYPLAENHRWVGNSELAASTSYLEYFSTAEFLKRIQIVDTPGTRSTIVSHEEAIRGFLLSEGRAERDSLHYGGVADCIIYVMPPILRQKDRDLLGEFSSLNRLPSSTPFNSVGVLHKWETLEHETPWIEAETLARRASATMNTVLCDVIVVSGPLAQAAAQCDLPVWEELLRFAQGTPKEALELLMLSEAKFTSAEGTGPLSAPSRMALRKATGLPRECFRTIVAFAAAGTFASGAVLRRAVEELSGVPRLLAFLEERFLSRSRLIRAANVMNRALRIADRAWGQLKNRQDDLAEMLKLGERAMTELGQMAPIAREYISRTMHDLRQESESLSQTLDRLSPQLWAIRRAFRPFEADCVAVQLLDAFPDQFSRSEVIDICTWLGAYGTQPGTVDLQATLDYWLVQHHAASGQRRLVLAAVVRRIEAKLGEVDS